MWSLTTSARNVRRLLALCVGASATIGVVTAEPPVVKGRVQVNRPEKFEFESLPAERISIGIPEDYKPNLAKLPSGELLLIGLFAPNQGGSRLSAVFFIDPLMVASPVRRYPCRQSGRV